jgi:hypothetical protein
MRCGRLEAGVTTAVTVALPVQAVDSAESPVLQFGRVCDGDPGPVLEPAGGASSHCYHAYYCT